MWRATRSCCWSTLSLWHQKKMMQKNCFASERSSNYTLNCLCAERTHWMRHSERHVTDTPRLSTTHYTLLCREKSEPTSNNFYLCTYRRSFIATETLSASTPSRTLWCATKQINQQLHPSKCLTVLWSSFGQLISIHIQSSEPHELLQKAKESFDVVATTEETD